jgi:hypothetical protein
MTHFDLPPAFKKVRKRYDKKDWPPVVVYVPAKNYDGFFAEVQNQRCNNADQYIGLKFYSWFWFETPGWAFHVCLGDHEGPRFEKTQPIEESILYADVYYHSEHLGRLEIDPHNVYTPLETGGFFNRTQTGLQAQQVLLIGLAYLSAQAEKQQHFLSTNTKTRNSARILERVGDTVRYARMSELSSKSGHNKLRGYEPPEPCSSGIKKCEHQVRGHWRTYSSGVRVWVKSHRRGDPELGTTTRVIGV